MTPGRSTITQIQASEVIVNIKKAPYSMIERLLHVNPYFVPSAGINLTRFAQTNHLSLFDSESAVKLYSRAGLPYNTNSPVTAVFLISPRHGAN